MVARVYNKNLVAIRNSAKNIEVINDALQRIARECPIVDDVATEEEDEYNNMISEFSLKPENNLADDECKKN